MGKSKKRTRYGRDAPVQAKRTEAAGGAVFTLTDPETWKILCGDGYKPIMQCPEVQICIGVYADLIASMTLRLMRNTEKGDVREKNELSRLLDIEPNRYMTHMTFFQTVVRGLMENGNQVTYPTYREGYLSELLPFKPSEVSLLSDGADGYQIGYRGRRFMPDEVLHFILNPDPNEPWRGQGYKISLRDIVKSLRQANATRQALQESPSPSIIVKVDGLTEEFKSAEGRAKLGAQFIDASENGRPWFIPAEAFDVVQVKPLTMNDLAIKTSLELDKRAIAAIFGIPPFLVGIGDFKLDEYQHFVTTRLMAVARVIEQTMTRGLLYSPDLYLSFNPRSLYNYSLTDLVNVGTQMIDHMAMRRNELRDWLGLPPDAEMDELLALENYIPASRLGDQEKLKGGGDGNEEDDGTPDPDA
ncbi:MAG: phage portal protein [Succinivibrionaceae bacterium]|nr:phage portal protein [Succinivibrionaceae bacterium]